MDNRPTFYTNDTKPIRAGGIIFYDQDPLTKQIKLLMQYTKKNDRNIYEDIGGKTDEKDTCINDTIIREVVEETNNIITKEILKDYLIKLNHHIYLPKSKYYLLLVKADKDIINIDRRKYGKTEIHSNKERQFHWINAQRLTFGTPFNDRIWFIRKQINEFFSTLL